MKGYRTIIWNGLNAMVLGMESVMNMAGTGYTIPERYMPLWMGVFTVVNIVLRFKTTTPVGKSDV